MIRFLGNTNSMVVHSDGCDSIEHIDPEDMWWFEELYQAIGHGFRECRACIGDDQTDWYRMVQQWDKDLRRKYFNQCVVCDETRGIQKAHITPRRHGGKAMMPLCPRCHWNYDHYLLNEEELKNVLLHIESEKGSEYADYVERNYRSKHWEKLDREAWVYGDNL